MTRPRAFRAPRFLARATPWFATRIILIRPRRRVTRSADRSVDPSSMTMTSAFCGSVSSKFSTVRASSRPSSRAMTTTLMLAGTGFQPDVGLQFAHRKEQPALAHREPREKPAAADLPERKPRGVEVVYGERLADRAFGTGV